MFIGKRYNTIISSIEMKMRDFFTQTTQSKSLLDLIVPRDAK